MRNKEIVYAIVGIAIGFILGFFTSRLTDSEASHFHPPHQASNPSEIPADHPSMEVMERLREYQTRAESHPEDKQVRVALGNEYYNMGRFDAAISWYEQALELQPQDADVTTDLGTSYLYNNNPGRAIELYRKAIEIQTDHPQAMQNLGFAYYATGEFDNAIDTWQRLLSTHKNYPHAAVIEKQMEEARQHMKGEIGQER
jgi:cytochrome c-type biogenesis protein CcmH/NrfG